MAVEIGREVAEGPLARLRCCGCGYGASCRIAPGRCPMCGGSAWEHDEWSPFSTMPGDPAGDDALMRDTAP
jgi:hypothetical protein